jgi:hypothetical protein
MRARLRLSLLLALLALLGLACVRAPTAPAPAEAPGTQVAMDFTLHGGFFSEPFPSEARREPDGGVDLTGFPNPTRNALVQQLIGLIRDSADGFGITSGIYFQLSAPLRADGLPSPLESLSPDAPVFLMNVEEGSPDFLKRQPVDVAYADDSGPYGAPRLLSLLPVQGLPLRAHERYAAVVLRDALDAQGQRLGVPLAMAQLAAGVAPEGLSAPAFAAHEQALHALARAGIPAQAIAGLAVFSTWDPTEGFRAFLSDALARPLPQPQAPFALHDVFPDYCVYQTTIAMTEYQQGDPPYSSGGGAWAVDASGKPVPQRDEPAHFVVTVPRHAMPSGGFPLVVFSRTGGGGDRPLVDRGTQQVHNGPPIVPGTGPAMFLAQAGFAGTSIDGPLGGLRNPTGGDEQVLIFNFDNPAAMRDNIRQSALELALTAHLMAQLHFDASDCPGFSAPSGTVGFDASHFVIMGHSMGATISPLALASEPMFEAAIFSGAGGSWIENVVYKQSPVTVLPLAEALLDVPPGYTMTEHDPLLTLLQWGGEPSDPPAYVRRVVREPGDGPARHVLMFQGIVDTYILPPIANSASLALGLDLAGPAYDAYAPALAKYATLESRLPLTDRHEIALPASGNVVAGNGKPVTAVVVQHVQDLVEDGHEVMFQTDAPKHQYRCFLQSLLQGTPTVPADASADAPCP